jgi:group I intron endonuclease
MYTIYYIKNKLTEEYYIGQTSNYEERMRAHKKQSRKIETRLQYAMNKYGIDNFEFNIIDIVSSKKEAAELEKFYIDKYNSHLAGYNMTPGGEWNQTGKRYTEEQKQYISECTKKGMDKKEIKDKLSDFWTEYYKTHTVWNKGIKTGPNPKISESKKGKPLVYHISQEELFKIRSEANKRVNADRHWYTNGEEDVRIHSDEIESYISKGYTKGRSQANGKNKKHNMKNGPKGKHWYIDSTTNKRVYYSE